MSFEADMEAIVDRVLSRHLGRLTHKEPDELLTVAEAAKIAKVGPATIRAWIAQGLLRRFGSSRVTRLRREDVLSVQEKSPAADMTPEDFVRQALGARKAAK